MAEESYIFVAPVPDYTGIRLVYARIVFMDGSLNSIIVSYPDGHVFAASDPGSDTLALLDITGCGVSGAGAIPDEELAEAIHALFETTFPAVYRVANGKLELIDYLDPPEEPDTTTVYVYIPADTLLSTPPPSPIASYALLAVTRDPEGDIVHIHAYHGGARTTIALSDNEAVIHLEATPAIISATRTTIDEAIETITSTIPRKMTYIGAYTTTTKNTQQPTTHI